MVVVINPSEGKPSMGKSIRNLSTVTRVGLDLAKRVFQVHPVDARGEIVVARKLTRSQLIPFFAELPPCVVAMEACASAHHWGRALIELGHEVRLLPPAQPYVRRNKNDAVDAAAICEAAGRPGQRFVPVRSIDNQADLMRHRTRDLLAGQRTARQYERERMMGRRATRTNQQGQRRHPSASTGRRHDRARGVHNSFKATLDHGAPSRHGCYLRYSGRLKSM
jgi:transposase